VLFLSIIRKHIPSYQYFKEAVMNIYRFPWGQRDDAQVLIVHFQSKSTPLIAQLLRQIGLQSRICLPEEFEQLAKGGHIPKAIILSGGPSGVYEKDAPLVSKELLGQLQNKGTVVIGICYGAQLLAQMYGGTVAPARQSESGVTHLTALTSNLGKYRGGKVVMNHNDEVVKLPKSWLNLGYTQKCQNALFTFRYQFWGMQFHPEMDHTEKGDVLMRHILYDAAGCIADYRFTPKRFADAACAYIRQVAGNRNMVVGLSGGVDSSTAYQLAVHALGRARVFAVYVDNGFMRENETAEVRAYFGDENIDYVDASADFYKEVERVRYTGSDGLYYKDIRVAIGRKFIEIFQDRLFRFKMKGKVGFLIQGTNESDIIESQTGLKAHHNVGGLPQDISLNILEPLAGLYKFEIREVAKNLKLPKEIITRQPFPGPGNSIRTWGPVTRAKAQALARANRILEEVIRKHYLNPKDRPCQYYVALMPLLTRGLVGDQGVDGLLWMVRAVGSNGRESYTTVENFWLNRECQEELSFRLTNEIKMDGIPFVGVTVMITGKPPATTEPH
jgi:GMP synthase (glutamine-hydrolysing)